VIKAPLHSFPNTLLNSDCLFAKTEKAAHFLFEFPILPLKEAFQKAVTV